MQNSIQIFVLIGGTTNKTRIYNVIENIRGAVTLMIEVLIFRGILTA